MILTVTLNPAVDHTIGLEEPLESGTVHRTDQRSFDPGGKGINVSMYLEELGAETVATGLIGGRVGSFIEHSLAQEGLEASFVEIDGMTRLNTTILTDGEEYKINQSGPPVRIERVSTLIDRIRTYHPDTVVVGGSLPPGLGSGIVDYLDSAGSWRTVVDTSGDIMKQLSRRYAMCAPNRDELEAATGMPVETIDQGFEAAQQLRRRGFERVLASFGDDGAILVGPRGNFHATVAEISPVDTAGAGDALLAGVLASLDDGKLDDRALAKGVAIATRTVETPGTVVPELNGLSTEIAEVDVTVRRETEQPGRYPTKRDGESSRVRRLSTTRSNHETDR